MALAADNLRASRGQAAYLILTLAITTAAWLTLATLASPHMGGKDSDGIGMIIRNGSQDSGSLPLTYASRIEAVNGARNVFWYGLQPVNCTTATMVTLNALGGPGTDNRLAMKQKIPAATIQRWNEDPLGAIISDAAASKCGWRVGQGVEPPSIMSGGKHVALHVIGIFSGSYPVGLVHYDYINRAAPGLQGKDKVVTFFASAANPRNDEVLAARIEAAFAHDFPSVNVTTNATEQDAWTRYGKVQQLLVLVMAAILLCAGSVLISVLAHSAAQRKSRFAMLQVLGFRRPTLFGAFILELLATMLPGALLGLGLAKLVAHELASTFFGFLANGVPMWAWWGLPVWLVVLAVAALAWPAGLIAQVRPADYRAI